MLKNIINLLELKYWEKYKRNDVYSLFLIL